MIQGINQALIIEKFIYGKFISSSSELVEVKCFLSRCGNTTILNYTELKGNSNMRNMIQGLKYFDDISDFYNNKYLLNACEAAINKNTNQAKFDYCLNNDTIIETANNTENLMKLMDNMIDNIYMQDEMDLYMNTYKDEKDKYYHRLKYFNDTYYQKIEYIFSTYVFPVGDFFEGIINNNLRDYLILKKEVQIILIFLLSLIMIIYCIIFFIVYIPRLIHYLSVSRSVINIIPVSIILKTNDLEKWIDNKSN